MLPTLRSIFDIWFSYSYFYNGLFQVPMMLSNPNLFDTNKRRDIVNAIEIILTSGFTNPPEDLLVKITEFSVKIGQKTTLLSLGKTLMTCPMDKGIRLKNWKTFISTWLSTTFNVKVSNSPLNGRIEVVRNILSTIFAEFERSSTNNTNISYEVSSIDLLVKSMFYTLNVNRHLSIIMYFTNILVDYIVCGETSGIGFCTYSRTLLTGLCFSGHFLEV